MNWPMLVLLTIAASRATHLVADDEIPFGPVRTWALKRFPTYGYGLGCSFCVSVYAGLAAAWMACGMDWVPNLGGWSAVALFMVVWFAIAQGIILLEGLVEFLMGSDD